MRFIFSTLLAILTCLLVMALDSKWLLPLPLGQFFSPHEGFWQNASSDRFVSDGLFQSKELKGKVDIYFDERMVPHVFAEKEVDAWFAQGYLHARARLWQMELQVLYASGRASEVLGEIALDHDREFRRLGMVYAAEKALHEMEKNDTTRLECDAYTAGVNAYINTLTKAKLPLEYKLLGYQPENWTNLKSALFLKYMSYDLAGFEKDFELTNAKKYFSSTDFALLFPDHADTSNPVIPETFGEENQWAILTPPTSLDSEYFRNVPAMVDHVEMPDRENGSNNWVISGNKTQSGYPILCNDPHLGLNLPSIWYEMQISAPGFNCYGVSFPGAPGIIIGFNENVAFGFTNGGRDVRDYYQVNFKDASRSQYYFDSNWVTSSRRIEEIRIAGKPSFYDTVIYTHFGPVMYDAAFGGKRTTNKENYVVRWKAHDPSNEMMFFNRLDRVRNYQDFQQTVPYLKTPGQNIAFAQKTGDIALYAQGEFPMKWKGQGDFIMPGIDSAYFWQNNIPQSQVPFQYNPERGFVSSANQNPADSTYPYYVGRDFPMIRGLYLNQKLSEDKAFTIRDMMDLQNDNHDLFAELICPALLSHVNASTLSSEQQQKRSMLSEWNFKDDAHSEAAAFFYRFWDAFYHEVFDDEFRNAPQPVAYPTQFTLWEALRRDSAYRFFDNVDTRQETETLDDVVRMAFNKACTVSGNQEPTGLSWSVMKALHIDHLLKLAPFGKKDLQVGGGKHCLNANESDHGPSWRMIVQMGEEPEAYGIYPGGQEGNPGSYYYDNFIPDWSAGKYYKLWLMKPSEAHSDKIHFAIRLRPTT